MKVFKFIGLEEKYIAAENVEEAKKFYIDLFDSHIFDVVMVDCDNEFIWYGISINHIDNHIFTDFLNENKDKTFEIRAKQGLYCDLEIKLNFKELLQLDGIIFKKPYLLEI